MLVPPSSVNLISFQDSNGFNRFSFIKLVDVIVRQCLLCSTACLIADGAMPIICREGGVLYSDLILRYFSEIPIIFLWLVPGNFIRAVIQYEMACCKYRTVRPWDSRYATTSKCYRWKGPLTPEGHRQTQTIYQCLHGVKQEASYRKLSLFHSVNFLPFKVNDVKIELKVWERSARAPPQS